MTERSRGEFRPMTEMNRSERLQIILTEEELAALDDWRFATRMPTRAAAIRELMKRGMAVQIDGDGAKGIGRRSRDVRLVERQSRPGNGPPHRGNGAQAD
jgi:hypothetical protein